MARLKIEIKNLDAISQIYRDLVDSYIPIGGITDVSIKNSFDAIKSSRELHQKILTDKAVLVVDDIEQSKEASLFWMHDALDRNEGQVKITSGNGVKPTYTWGGIGNPVAGTEVKIAYDSPLGYASFPTTQFPQNVASPTDADIYDFLNNTFVENSVLGQSNHWRVIFNFSGKAPGLVTGIVVRFNNTLSSFIAETIVTIPEERTSGSIFVDITTIADTNSLPAPFGTGQGYEISLIPDDNIVIEIESVTRFNYQKNKR